MRRGRLTRAAAILGLWSVAAALYAAHLLVYHTVRNEKTTYLFQLAEAMGHCLTWAALTPLVLVLARRFLIHRRLRNVAAHVVFAATVAIAQVGLHALAEVVVHRVVSFEFVGERFVKLFARTYVANLMIYAALVIAYWLIESYAERRSAAAKLEADLANARLDALRASVRPHFLFNALNSIAALVRHDPSRAETMIGSLGELLRAAVARDGRREIRLSEEAELVSMYVEIEKMRFEERLDVAMDIRENAADALVPALLLQPLVENAIRHGMNRRDALHVRITAMREGERLQISVRDDGGGLGRDGVEGVGIPSARERLRGLHGDRFTFAVDSAAGQGVDVRIELPWREEGA